MPPTEDAKQLILEGIALSAKDKEQALRLFIKATELEPNNPEAWFQRGRLTKDERESQTYLLQATQLDPGYSDAWRCLAGTNYNYKKYDDALLYVEKLLQINPTDPERMEFKAIILSAAHRFKDAIPILQKILVDYPDYKEKKSVMMELAQALLIEDRPQEAQSFYTKLIELEPNNDYYKSQKIECEKAIERANQTVDGYRKAVERDPKDVKSLDKLVDALEMEGRYIDALNYLDQLISLAPEDYLLLARKAFILRALGRDLDAKPIEKEFYKRQNNDPKYNFKKSLSQIHFNEKLLTLLKWVLVFSLGVGLVCITIGIITLNGSRTAGGIFILIVAGLGALFYAPLVWYMKWSRKRLKEKHPQLYDEAQKDKEKK